MRFLLKLKHWQLFVLTWGIPIIVNILTFANPMLMLKLFPILMLAFAFGTFGWIWAIATQLHKQLPDNVELNLTSFKMYFAIPLLYILTIILFMGYQFNIGTTEADLNQGWIVGVIMILHLSSMVCIFLGLRFAAKTMKSVEIGRLARFGDYAGEFFLIWFSIIGYWVLQPRLNRLIAEANK